jgi:hypothetical protein
VNGQSYVSAGHYDDTLVRVDGQWKFAVRLLTFYFLSPLSEGFAGRPFPGRSAASEGQGRDTWKPESRPTSI